MARPQADAVALVEKRGEERQADDVVVMGVGEEDVSLEGAVLAELLAERPQARSGVEDQQLVAATHLDAGSVAAIPRVTFAWTGDRATGSPKTDKKIWALLQVAVSLRSHTHYSGLQIDRKSVV